MLSSIIMLASSISSYSQTQVTSYGTGAGTLGIKNSTFGYNAGKQNTSASQHNTFIGFNSGHNNNAYDNTFVGYLSGQNNVNGYYNMFAGAYAGLNNVSGTDNTFIGHESGYNSTGNFNVSVGAKAGRNITTGSDNISIGVAAAGGFTNQEAGGVTTTRGSIFIGNNAGRVSTLTEGYNIVLGYGAGLNHTFPTGSSVFLVNNQAQMSNPILYGTFANNSDHFNSLSTATSDASLAINTKVLQPDMALTVNGRICIGDFSNGQTKTQPSATSLQNYSLWVEKGVVANNFAVVDVADWADHVFNVDYDLMPLSDVANYIQKNNHLPNIPSESDLKKDGYDIHGMNKKFMTKIEELTLYTIAQEKKIDEQQVKIDALNTALEDYKQLAQQLQELKNMIDNNNKQ